MKKTDARSLVKFLSSKESSAKFLDKLKIVYRPYICPFDALLKEIPISASVFDVGCGSGQFALLVAEYRAPKKIKGIEISGALVNNAQKLLNSYSSNIQIVFEKYNGIDIPDDIGEYDYITMIDVAHHIPKKNINRFFYQLHTKMKKNSVLIYKDINAASPLVFANKFHDFIFAGTIGNEISLSNTLQLFKKMNFSIEHFSKQTMFWYPHFTIIAKK